jgi:anti-sigma regulatory factor (Ser/Thr protein kinase)/anti-anti-sigma regulatory factor
MTSQPVILTLAGAFDFEALPSFTQSLHRVSTGESRRFILDLSNLGFCEPVALTCLAAGVHYLTLREQECVEVTRPVSNEVNGYLERLGLFEMIGEKKLYPFQQHSPEGRFLELTRITSRAQVSPATSAMCEVFANGFELEETSRTALDTILSELVENVFHHAQSPTGAYLCCQRYSDRISASIVDLGEGIRVRLSDTETLRKDVQRIGGPLRAAITPRITSRPSHNSGYGLALTSGLAGQNRGRLQIYSQTDRLVQTGQEIVESIMPERWPGTVITIDFFRGQPLDLSRLYKEIWPQAPEEDFDFLDN